MFKSIGVLAAVLLFSLPAFAQESSLLSTLKEIPLQLSDTLPKGKTPGFLEENIISIMFLSPSLEKVERMPIAKGPKDFYSNMPMLEVSDSLNYNMPKLRERKDR